MDKFYLILRDKILTISLKILHVLEYYY